MIILFYGGSVPRVTEEYRDVRRQQIADAALRAFRRRGFQATSMAEIIAESGLSAGAIYGHFKGKSEIVFEVATRVVGARIGDIERLAERDSMPSPAELLRLIMAGMLKDVGNPAILVQIWGEAVTDPVLKQLVQGVLARLRDTWTRYISLWHQREHGLAESEADAIAAEQVHLFVSAAQGYLLQSALLSDFDSEAFLSGVEKHLPR